MALPFPSIATSYFTHTTIILAHQEVEKRRALLLLLLEQDYLNSYSAQGLGRMEDVEQRSGVPIPKSANSFEPQVVREAMEVRLDGEGA